MAFVFFFQIKKIKRIKILKMNFIIYHFTMVTWGGYNLGKLGQPNCKPAVSGQIT